MIGKVIGGRYQIIQKLGAGGFGQTFLAEDLQLPDHHRCVVKHLKPASNDTFVLQIASRLFETEARVLHLLGSHDRIPRLLAHFEEDCDFYLVQELIDGNNLTNELHPNQRSVDGYPIGRMDEDQAIAFLIDVLEILTFVHQHGAIHRDIKPANLMRRHSDGKIVLIDFGAVKQVGTAISSSSISTVAIGTDGYMPNEQAIGKPRPCSDLYAVGAIAIQGLTGVPPNLLSEDMETGELAWRKSPTDANFKYRTSISEDLAVVIDKLVKYDFRDRYQSAEEILATLRQLRLTRLYLVNSPVPNSPVPNLPASLITNIQTNPQKSLASSHLGYQIAPTVLSANVASTITKIPPKALPIEKTNISSLKWKNLLGISMVGMVSAIAVISAVMFLRPSPAFKNDLNTHTTSLNVKYLYLSERLITDEDLSGKSSLELDIMRNEVFARYGRRFQSPELQSYFNSQPWYRPMYAPEKFPEEVLTPTELHNVQYIRDFQIRVAQRSNSSLNLNNSLADSQCDNTKRLVSDPNPPINVRVGGGVEHKIVGTLDNGIQITVTREERGWLQISAPIAGWVAANRTKSICFF